MKRIRAIIGTSLFCAVAGLLGAQASAAYHLGNIPPKLLANANAVIREINVSVQISSPSKLETRYRRVVTVLNKQGADWGEMALHYDGYRALGSVSCQLFDGKGEIRKKYGKKDFQDLDTSGDALVDDSRCLYLDLSGLEPPYTIALDYSMSASSAFFCPSFWPQEEFNTAVEFAACIVQVPNEGDLLYLNERSPEPVITDEGAKKKYQWVFQNLAAIPDEPYNLPLSMLAPVVHLQPRVFQIGLFSGSLDSWDGIADWTNQMVTALPELNTEAKQQIQRLTAGKTEREKIHAVYRFVQNSTRYVGIQLGIGGWQPFDPNVVHAKKYGDCKALTWYTKALLEAVGIQSYYTLVSAGSQPSVLIPDFPSKTFNHVFLTVPTSDGDTLHLECTSQINPPGYTGTSTGKRLALLIAGDKARLIHVPTSSSTDNVLLDSVFVRIQDAQTPVNIHWKKTWKGVSVEDDGLLELVSNTDPQVRKKWFEQQFAVKGGRITASDLQLEPHRTTIPEGYALAETSSGQLLNVTAKRMYFQPNVFQMWPTLLPPDSARLSPVFWRFGRTRIADITYEIPPNWKPESLPASVDLTNTFGTYSRKVIFHEGTLLYRRSITLADGTFPADQYNTLVEFFGKMKKMDGERAVFVQNE